MTESQAPTFLGSPPAGGARSRSRSAGVSVFKQASVFSRTASAYPCKLATVGLNAATCLQRITNATLAGIGRHVKLLVPAPFNPHLWLATDIGNNPVFHARGVPQGPANRIALISRAFGQIRIREPVECSLNEIVHVDQSAQC